MEEPLPPPVEEPLPLPVEEPLPLPVEEPLPPPVEEPLLADGDYGGEEVEDTASELCSDAVSCEYAQELYQGSPAGLEEFCAASPGGNSCPVLCGDPRCSGGNITLPTPGTVFDAVLVEEEDGDFMPQPVPDFPGNPVDAPPLTDPLVSAQPPPQDLVAAPSLFRGAVALSFGYCHLGAPATSFTVVCSQLGNPTIFKSSRLEVADCGAPTFEATLVFDEPDLRPVATPSGDGTYACSARAEGDLGVSEPSNTVYLEPGSRSLWPSAPPPRPACPGTLGIAPPPPQQVHPVNPPTSDAVTLEWAYCGLRAGVWADYFDVSCSALNTAGVFLDADASEALLTGGSLLPVEKKEVREPAGCFQQLARATVSGLIPGVTYECRVAAVGPLGPSEFSEPAFPTVGWGGAADTWTVEQASSFCTFQYDAADDFGSGGRRR